MISSRLGSNSGTSTASAPPAMALMSARYPQRRPITSTTWARWWELAVSFMRSMASRAVFKAVYPDSCVGAPHVVVYCCRDPHNLDPALLQPQCPSQAPLPADHHEPFYACLL